MQYHKINNAKLSSILGGEVTGYLATTTAAATKTSLKK